MEYRKTVDQNAHQAQVVLGRHRLSAMGEYDVLTQNAEHLGSLLGEQLFPVATQD